MDRKTSLDRWASKSQNTSKDSSPSSTETKEDGKTLSGSYSLSIEEAEAIDKVDANPAVRAQRIQQLVMNADPYDLLCFCVLTLPAVIASAPPYIHNLVKGIAKYVYQYHYFVRNARRK